MNRKTWENKTHGHKILGSVMYMGGVPSVLEEFTHSWGQMIAFNANYVCQPGEDIYYDRAKQSHHESARNGMTKVFVGDWLLMLDTDHVFDPDLLSRILTQVVALDLDVVTGLYHYKAEPHFPVLYDWIEDEGRYFIKTEIPSEEPFRVHGAGGGCLFIKRSVFKRIREELGEMPFTERKPFDHLEANKLSEDISFCDRLRQLDIPLYCLPKVEYKHLKMTEIGLDDFKRFCDLYQVKEK